MKSDRIQFHGGSVFLLTERTKRAASGRQRLDRNPFRERWPGLLSETEDERSRWRGRARKFLKACYDEAKLRLGEDEARALFVEAIPGRKRGHRAGTTGRPGLLPDLPTILLAAHDAWALEARDEKEKVTIPGGLRRISA
jgi:hypothetical protein